MEGSGEAELERVSEGSVEAVGKAEGERPACREAVTPGLALAARLREGVAEGQVVALAVREGCSGEGVGEVDTESLGEGLALREGCGEAVAEGEEAEEAVAFTVALAARLLRGLSEAEGEAEGEGLGRGERLGSAVTEGEGEGAADLEELRVTPAGPREAVLPR
jgi:hypothetical protein